MIEKGRTSYNIVIPDKSARVESKAAAVLQKYLKLASKIQFPIVTESDNKSLKSIYLGYCNLTKTLNSTPALGEINVSVKSGNVLLAGGKGQNTLYAVYTFLEELGFRKYDGSDAVVPDLSESAWVSNNLNIRYKPQLEYRQAYYPESNDPEYMEWHKLQKFEDLWGVWGHSYFKIVPPGTYYNAHPEYFALVKGKRQATQLCLSNENVYKLAVQFFKEKIARYPDAIYFSISPNDDLGYCTCDLCKKADEEEGGPQGSLIRFVNRVAEQFPKVNFTTLAYTYTSHPPKKTKPRGNVYPFLSSIDAYRTNPLETEPSAVAFRKDLEGWTKISSNVFIWDYTTQFTNYLAPFPDYDNLGKNLRYFKSKGVKGVFSQGPGDTYGDLSELNSYLQAKLLWDPSADGKSIEAEFLNGYYGKAGEFIAQYISSMQEELKAQKVKLDIYGNPINNYSDYLSPQLIDHYSALLDKAEAAVEGNSKFTERVQKARLPLEYVVLQQSRFFGSEKFGYLVEQGSMVTVNPKWPAKVKRFTDAAKNAGVTELSEGGLSPEAYFKEWAELFNKKYEINIAGNAKVTLANQFSLEYPAKREKTLVDGLPGGDDFSSNWLLFYNKDLVATIDIGSVKTIKQISPTFLNDPRHYIFYPSSIKIEYSTDGATYKMLKESHLSSLNKVEDYSITIKKIDSNQSAQIKARFIRLTAVCPAELPAWRVRLNKKPTIACDEILIK